MKDALVIEREIVPPSLASVAIDRTLRTSIDTTLSPLLRTGEEVSHSEKLVKPKVKNELSNADLQNVVRDHQRMVGD